MGCKRKIKSGNTGERGEKKRNETQNRKLFYVNYHIEDNTYRYTSANKKSRRS